VDADGVVAQPDIGEAPLVLEDAHVDKGRVDRQDGQWDVIEEEAVEERQTIPRYEGGKRGHKGKGKRKSGVPGKPACDLLPW
jgi:hypothetical protein